MRGRTTPSNIPDAFIFRAAGRFIVPAGWSFTPNRLDNNVEYVQLETADGAATVFIFDISPVVGDSVPYEAVISASGLDLQSELGISLSSGEMVRLDGRDAYRYALTVNGQSGTLLVVRFDNGGAGLVIAYGATDTYAADINVLIGSFNNLGVLVNYIQ
jgi:hypothetical protein